MSMSSPQFATMNDGADFWYYEIGVNVIPVYSQNKNKKDNFTPLSGYSEWFEKDLDEATFNEWKQKKLFDNGVAIIGGLVYRGLYKDQYLGMIDLDNQLAIDEFCTKGIKQAGQVTLIEQHQDAPDRAHVYFYTTKPLHKKVLTTKQKNETDKPKIEVKGDGPHGIHIVTPSLHTNGERYQIVSDVRKPYSTAENLETKIKAICDKHGIPYLTTDDGLVPVTDMLQDDFAVYAGENRHLAVMRYMESKRIGNPEFPDDMILSLAKEFNKKHCVPPLEPDDAVWVREFNSAKKFTAPIIKKNAEQKTAQLGTKLSKTKAIIDNTAKLIREKYDFATMRETDEILLYDGKIYSKTKAESIIREETEDIIENCTTHERNEVINKIKAQTHADLAQFDGDPNMITVNNGILNLETLELSEHNPGNLSRVLLPVDYFPPTNPISDETIFADIEKNIGDTLFYKFLKSSFTVNKEFKQKDFETVLEIVACPIIKRHIDEKAFMFLGSGENGKSVCLDFIRGLLGDNNISRIPLQDIADDKFMRAGLVGKSANIFTDLEAGEMKHTGKIKAITSGEGIEAQEKYKTAFTMYPFAKMMFSCNRFPKIYDQSQGFFRRWMIIKWERNFERDPERIEYLREKLAANEAEKTRVFSSLVYLARRLNRVGRFSHTKDWKTTQNEWNENADPLDYFVSNYTKDSDGNRTKREMYRFYKLVMQAKGEAPLGMGQFSKVFEEYYDYGLVENKETKKTERVWLNVDFEPLDLKEFMPK